MPEGFPLRAQESTTVLVLVTVQTKYHECLCYGMKMHKYVLLTKPAERIKVRESVSP